MAVSAPRPPYQLLGVFLLLALAFLGIEYRYGLDQKAAVEKEVGAHLLDVATVKVKLLSTWRQHRLGEMEAVVASPGAMWKAASASVSATSSRWAPTSHCWSRP